MIKNVIIPKYIYNGILHNDISFPKRLKIFGADTETVHGEPYTFQVSSDGKSADLVFVNSKNVLDKFLAYIRPRLLRGQVNVMYFHNLKFDLPVLLKNYQALFAGNTKIEIIHKGVELDFVVAKVYFGRIRFPENKVLTLIDSYAFFVNYGKASLGYLAKELNLPHKKFGRLKSIGKKYYKEGTSDYKKFTQYSKQDAVVEWHLGSWIVGQYKKYKTRVCVSSPQFSMRVFRHYFLKSGDCIAFPPPEALRGCILSYHGGKNGYYVKGVTVVKKCTEVDVVSMYPYAMKSIPNFLSGKYFRTSRFNPDYEGVYCISGSIRPCRYPVLFSHDFKPLSGKIKEIWVTSYELRAALKYREIILTGCRGYLWKPDPFVKRNPFADFVDYFFKLKDTAPNKAERILAKLILNSLYGKTIQTIEDDDKDRKKFKPDARFDPAKDVFIELRGNNIFLAGGMFNPFIASLITGFARAYLHELEHKYKALHSSTDSIKTILPVKEDKRLGGIKIECQGRCVLFRNKLYLHYNEYFPRELEKFRKKYCDILKDKRSWLHKEARRSLRVLESGKKAQMLEKYALHGFIGTPQNLIDMFDKKQNKYKTEHLYKVREALRQKKTPLDFQVVDRELLGVDFNKVTNIP